jgi:hypothetical protein
MVGQGAEPSDEIHEHGSFRSRTGVIAEPCKFMMLSTVPHRLTEQRSQKAGHPLGQRVERRCGEVE